MDFYIAEQKIVIEIDGSQHGEPEHRRADEERDAFLREYGITVLRYTNSDIKKRFDSVVEDILKYIGLTAMDVWK